MKLAVPLFLLVGLSLALSVLGKDKRGTLLGVPYNLEWPTPARIARSIWNPHDRRMLTTHVFGWGYSFNLHPVGRRLGLV